MAVKFDLGNGTFVTAPTDTMLITTSRGMVAANLIVQGDFICNVEGLPRNEVMAPPVVV